MVHSFLYDFEAQIFECFNWADNFFGHRNNENLMLMGRYRCAQREIRWTGYLDYTVPANYIV